MNEEINLFSPHEVKTLLSKHGLKPLKRLGQNYLVDRNVLQKIVEAADINESDAVLEIGPGLGSLTKELAKLAEKVVSVEVDRGLIRVLDETLASFRNVEVVSADFLKLDLDELLQERFGEKQCIAAANLPYYITSPLIAKLIASKNRIKRMVVMVQDEVAERMTAAPASKHYGAFSVFVQYHCLVKKAARAKRTVFYPSPDVDSMVVRMDIADQARAVVDDEDRFFKVVRAAFGQRRKTLLSSLSRNPDLKWSRSKTLETLTSAEIDPLRRGETLSIEEFARLTIASANFD